MLPLICCLTVTSSNANKWKSPATPRGLLPYHIVSSYGPSSIGSPSVAVESALAERAMPLGNPYVTAKRAEVAPLKRRFPIVFFMVIPSFHKKFSKIPFPKKPKMYAASSA